MIKEIIFQTINRTTPNMSLEATYRTPKGQTLTLLKTGQVISGPYDQKLHGDRDDLKIGKDREYILSLHGKEDAVKLDFWAGHSSIVVPGPSGTNKNENCKRPLVKMIDKEVEGKVKTLDRKLKLQVGNIVNHLDDHSQWNLAVVLGVKNITTLNTNDIYNAVCDYAEAKPLETLKLLKRNDLEKLVIVKKAVALEVIKDTGTVYMFGETVLGVSPKIEEVIAYCEHNAEHYQAIRRQVAFHDNLPVSFKKDQANAGVIAIKDLADLDEVIFRAETDQESLGQISTGELAKAGPGRKKADAK